LPRVLDDVFADPVGLQQRHEAALAWFESRIAPGAVGRQIADAAR
jgi:hypothetical protein